MSDPEFPFLTLLILTTLTVALFRTVRAHDVGSGSPGTGEARQLSWHRLVLVPRARGANRVCVEVTRWTQNCKNKYNEEKKTTAT